MDKIIKDLIRFLNTALDSKTDHQFYFNTYRYIEFIEKNKIISDIIQKKVLDYSKSFSKINKPPRIKSDEIYSVMSIETLILEQDSPFVVDYAVLKARIYTNVLWDQENHKERCSWYDNKRNEYQDRLKRFHTNLLEILKKLKDFQFDLQTGDFKFFKIKGTIPLGTQEYKVFSTLYKSINYQATYLELLKSYNPNIEVASKSYRDGLLSIIRNLKQKFGILPKRKTSNPDIFLNINKVGYRLVFSHNKNDPE